MTKKELIATLLKMQAEEQAKAIGVPIEAPPVIGIELSEQEQAVLEGVLRFKPSYHGGTRFELMNALLKSRGQKELSSEVWASAQQSLIHKGLLTPMGLLSRAGRVSVERSVPLSR